MVDRKTVLMAVCLILLGGCGSDAGKTADPAGNGKGDGIAVEERNKLLEQVKQNNPFEYEIVYEVTKDYPKAMTTYIEFKNNNKDNAADVLFTNVKGRDVSVQDFEDELKERSLPGNYSSVISDYFKMCEKNELEKAMALIEPKSSFQMATGADIQSFKSRLDEAKNVTRVADVMPERYRLVDQGGVFLLEVTFKTAGFWNPMVMEGPPRDIEEQILKTAPNNPAQYAKDNLLDTSKPSANDAKDSKADWSYRQSGMIRFRLKPANGKWLIHDQI